MSIDPDTRSVFARNAALTLIEAEFAAAVADGNLEAAEGWLATAIWVAERQRDRA